MIPVGSDPLASGNFIQPRPTFAGTPGKSNCHGKSVSALAQQYGGLNNAAAALGYRSVSALQNAIEDCCEA
jgi:spore maturation protein SpmA